MKQNATERDDGMAGHTAETARQLVAQAATLVSARNNQGPLATNHCFWCSAAFIPSRDSFGAFCSRACGDAEMAGGPKPAPQPAPKPYMSLAETRRTLGAALDAAGIAHREPIGREAQLVRNRSRR